MARPTLRSKSFKLSTLGACSIPNVIKSGVNIHSVDVACVPMNRAHARGMVVQEKAALETLSARSSQPNVVDGHADDHDRVEECQSAMEN